MGLDVVAAHSIVLDDDDIDLIVASETGLVNSPESNMKLASGAMRVTDLLRVDAKIGLSTDGPSSNDNLNMFEAMLVAPLLQKVVNLDTTVIAASDVLVMATIGGARAIGLDSKVGSIEVGKQADIIIIDGNKPNMVPAYNLESLLVYGASGSDVRTTIVDGKVLYMDGTFYTLDYDSIIEAARAEALKVREAVSI